MLATGRSDKPDHDNLLLERLTTLASLQRLTAFTILSGVLLGFSAGMAVDAVTGRPPFYMARQTLMGLLAGLIAPAVAVLVSWVAKQLIHGRRLRRPSTYWPTIYTTSGLLTGLALMTLYQSLPTPPFTFGAAVLIYPIASVIIFVPVALFSDTYESAYLQERRTRELFSRYVSGHVVDRLLARAEPVSLTGERRHVSVLFSDIRGFSRLSHGMPAEQVVAALNDYFTLMVDVVFQFGGSVDKFMGDGLMVLFGAPLATGDEAIRAAQAAQEMHRQVQLFNATTRHRLSGPVGIGIGIDTGEVVTGNVGSPRRLEYTAIGSVVNNAFYLSKISASGETLLTQATCDELRNTMETAPWQSLRLRGADKETQIYAIKTHDA